MKTIMILGGSILQLPAIEKAINMGLRVVVVDKDPKAIGFNVNNVIKKILVLQISLGFVRQQNFIILME